MPRLPIEKVKPGMLVLHPITNEKGMVLCSKGTALSEAVLERLARIGVGWVVVEGEEDPGSAMAPAVKERIRKEIDQRFSKVEADPFMLDIKQAILRLKLGPS
ncbi:MAG: hypothetical protein HYY13_06575 [Nitrospirae bacterium]|nr:hypothetical protein [Nitrospirota bacterium]